MNELIQIINQALTMEHAAYLQYVTHAEQLKGCCSEPNIAQLREQAADELKHATELRRILSDFFGAVPTTDAAPVKSSTGELAEVLDLNIASEKEAITLYRQIYQIIQDLKVGSSDMVFCWFNFEEAIREILVDEEQHAAELIRLQGGCGCH
jgi:bacterioferritin (cytochrome b1)